MEKLHIKLPIIVEGKYDKIKLDSILDARIFTTGGFALFRDEKRMKMLMSIAKDGVIILCDSDGGGTLIRSHLTSSIPNDKIYQLYTPSVKGKEKRKKTASAEGNLGVEGIDSGTLRALFLPFEDKDSIERSTITKTDLFRLGLSGGEDSQKKRRLLCSYLGLPDKISTNALLSTLNVTLSTEELYDICYRIFSEKE